MSIRILATFIGIFSLLVSQAQSDIDFQPRLLFKELVKEGSKHQSELSMITIPQRLANHFISGAFFTIANTAGTQSIRYGYIGRVNSCRSGGCSISNENQTDQIHEYFDYFILFNAEGTVQCVRVFNYQATHGEGITSAIWLKQFNGYKGEEALRTGKNIDAISGATISVEGIAGDVQDKTRLLNQIIRLENLSEQMF